MKKYLMVVFMIAISVFVLASGAFANEKIETVTLYWDWNGPTPETSGLDSADPIANDLEWHLYMRGEGEEYGTEPVVIAPYEGDLSIVNEVFISGVGGTTVRKYFVLRSAYSGGESANSNEVFKDFVLPLNAPLNLRFTVVVE